MLAMLEKVVKDAGASLMFCDTDSGCIPATKNGKPGTLSYATVDKIRKRFNSLNPYNLKIVPELLKWELPAKRDGKTLFGAAISAKRYALWHVINGKPDLVKIQDDEEFDELEIVKRSEHGLGLYMNPAVTHASNEKQIQNGDWYREAWHYLIARHVLGLKASEPKWLDYPAVSRFPVKSLHIWETFRDYNAGKPVNQQVIPYNFFLAVHPSRIEKIFNPKMRLIAPFERDSSKWPGMTVIDIHSRKRYRITTDPVKAITGKVILVKTYREILSQYIDHPEIKYDDKNGNPCKAETRGALRPCHIHAMSYQHVTKDSSSITTVSEAYLHDGPFIYNDDSGERTAAIAREVFQAYEYGRGRIANETKTTEKEARDFLEGRTSRNPRPYIELAAKLATSDLSNVRRRESSRQILARWKIWHG